MFESAGCIAATGPDKVVLKIFQQAVSSVISHFVSDSMRPVHVALRKTRNGLYYLS